MAYPEMYNLLMEEPLDPRLEELVAPWRNSDDIPPPEVMQQIRATVRQIQSERE